MSNIFESSRLKEDYLNFEEALFKTNNFLFKVEGKIQTELKKQHRICYSLALLISKLESEYSDENKYIFIKEIVSDILSNFSLCFLGFYFSSQTVVRRIIENFYNHIYYFDHPIEYQHLNLGKNEYVPILDLKKYFESYPNLNYDVKLRDNNNDIFNHYQELCKVVHSKGQEFMGLAKNIEDIKPSFDLEKHILKLNNTFAAILYLLFKFHNNISFTNVEKDIIVKVFPRNERSALQE